MPLSVNRAGAGSGKGSYYGDASYRTAMLRKQAIIATQLAKNPPFDQEQKPLISEHHLTKGFDNGVKEAILQRNPNGFI